MPDLSSYATAMRTNGHQLRGWLSVFKGASVCSGTLTFTIVDYPTSNIIISVTAGSIANIERGAEVIITDSSNNYKGRLRVRRGGTISSTNLPVAEVEKATIELVSGDKFSVLSEHRIRPVIPSADPTFSPDQETYTDQTLIMPPVAVTGGPICQWVDSGQTYATIDFKSASYKADADGSSTLTHAWTFPAGSSPTSSTSANPSGVQIPAGEHWVKYVVTNQSRTHTHWIPVWVHNTSNLPYEVEVESLPADLASGWQATFRLQQAASLDNLPDGSLCVFWIEEYIGGTKQSIGNTFVARSRHKFMGWHFADRSESSATGKTLRIECRGALQILQEMVGFSQVFEENQAAANWQEIDDLSVKRAIIEVLRAYTTALDLIDLTFDITTDYLYPTYYLQKNTPLAMVREIADGINSRFVCTRTGELQIQTRPEFVELGDRDDLDTLYTLTQDDILSITINRTPRYKVDLLEMKGILNNGTAGYYSHYPGNAPGDGAQNVTYDKRITDNQTNLNRDAGLAGAWEDKVFINSSKRLFYAPSVDVVLRGSYDVFDFYKAWIKFDLPSSYNWRGITLSTFRFILQAVNVQYSDGTATVTLSLQAETAAPPGTTFIPPAPPAGSIPPYDYDPPYYPTPPNNGGYMPLTDNILAITVDGHLLATTNFTDATPVWTDTDISASIPAEVVVMRVDPRSPCYLGTGSALNVWVMSLDGIYYIENAESATPTVTSKFFFEAPLIDKERAGMDIAYTGDPGRRGICYYFNDLVNEGWYASMSDGVNWSGSGEEFSETAVNVIYYNTTIDPHSGDEYTYNRSEDNYPAIVPYVNGEADDGYLASGGSANMGTHLMSMYFPYAINPSRYMWAVRISSGGGAQLYVMDILSKIGFGGSDAPDLDNVGPYIGNAFVISSPSGNANKLMYAAATASGASLQYTENALEFGNIHWTEIGKSLIADWIGCAMVDPDGEGAYCWGSGAIYFWTGGTTLVAKNGTGFTSSDVIGIAGY